MMNLKPKFLAVLLSILYSTMAYSQYSNKEDIYLNFNNEIENCKYDWMKLKMVKEKGVQFNLCAKALVLFTKGSNADTLALDRLKDIQFTPAEKVDSHVLAWRKSNHQALRDHYKGPYPKFDKNGMFNTFLVEFLEDQDCIVVYPVIWPNEDSLPIH